jgi:pimeloyl-ACP methyl ester carboxylesterase
MSKLGYPTLAIDRLGAGLSDHPDPVTEVQANLQTNIHHIIVQMARAGKIPHTNTAFKKIIFVGGSYGSILGNQQAIQYPNDLDALLLTAYTNDDQLLVPIFSIQTIAAPAAIVDASHWATLPLAYLTNTGAIGRGYLYDGPASYDQDIFNYDEENRGTITLGEALTANAGTAVAPKFKGQVHLITGAEDSVFCGTGVDNLGGIVRQGNCTPNGKNIPAMSKSYFPAAKSFSYTIIPNTGHVTVLHKTVKQTFTSAANFLAASGY